MRLTITAVVEINTNDDGVDDGMNIFVRKDMETIETVVEAVLEVLHCVDSVEYVEVEA